MEKLSLASDSNSRLNKEVISGAIWPVPLSCPHRLKDFSKTHGRLLTHLIRALHRGRMLEQEQAGVVNNGDPKDLS